MHLRARVVPAILLVAVVALAGCGSGTKKKKAAPPPPTTTTTVPPPAVTISPDTAQSGTKLTLAVNHFTAGDSVTFEIDMPGGRKFVGQPHVVATDGTVSTTFLVTSQNPVGDYVVHATTDKGQAAEAHFTVAAGTAAPTTTAKPAATTTTAKPRTP